MGYLTMTRALLVTSLIIIMLSACSTPPRPARYRCPHPTFGWQWCDEPYGGRK